MGETWCPSCRAGACGAHGETQTEKYRALVAALRDAKGLTTAAVREAERVVSVTYGDPLWHVPLSHEPSEADLEAARAILGYDPYEDGAAAMECEPDYGSLAERIRSEQIRLYSRSTAERMLSECDDCGRTDGTHNYDVEH